MTEKELARPCRVAVIWIDWYPYHVARFRGMVDALPGQVAGIELVGGIGVHVGMKFRETLPEGLSVQTLLPTGSWNTADKWSLSRALWRKLSELQPAVVLVPGYYTLPGFAAALWARVHGAQSVLMSESTASDHLRTGWKEMLKSGVVRSLFDWAIVGGMRHVAYLAQLGYPTDRVLRSYDVVDNQFFATGTAALRRNHPLQVPADVPSGPSFLYVGRLAEEKNIARLLSCWIVYREQGGCWPLVLVGNGPEMTGLRAIAEATSYATDVWFAGMRSSHELLPFYAAAGCFILPSTREPWGLVVNEAMASELPVLVSTHCGCADDLVENGSNGFTFDPRDETELTALLHQVASLSVEMREEMGRASAERIGAFSPKHLGASVRTIVERCRPLAASVLAGGPR